MSRGKSPETSRSRPTEAADTAARLAEGLACHQSGQVEKAEAIYRQVLDAEPDDPGALHYLGVIRLQGGRLEDAAELIEKALALAPEDADALNNLGQVRQRQGDLDGALSSFERALEVDPGYVEACIGLGNALLGQGRELDALAAFGRALEIDPGNADAHNGLGLAHVAFREPGKRGDAAAAFERALALDPGYLEAANNLGNALMSLDRPDEALKVHEDMIEIHSELAEAHFNFGNMVYNSLGVTLHGLEWLDSAVASFRRALAIDPDHADAHRNLGLVLLLQGRLGEGWTEYGWRWQARLGKRSRRDFPHPLWPGTGARGKTILVWAEQGVGDEVMFASMVPDLVDAGAKVVLECDPRLVPLFERSFPGVRCVAKEDPPVAETRREDIDFQVPSGGLGRWLRPDLDAFPGRASYLVADGDKRGALRESYLADGDDLLVGVAWLSKSRILGPRKSMSLIDLRPLTDVPGVKFIDLQYGDTEAERRAFAEETGTAVVHDGGVDQMADLDAFAAQVAAMDLVVSVSNTTVHLAGALGVATWVMLNTVPLPVWMLEKEDSPWYPSVRLFRQTRAGVWADVIERVAGELAALARG